uniref:Protein S-acyltransferase n=1 Tax=Gossypium raimondii TaxID=29730 RepID=A0A0D2UJ43_GOSRA|nr:hypothetical protein B456_011G2379002 [Gossypium raimondii]
MKLKNFLSIPIFSVFFVMGFVYYVTVFILIEDWVGLQTSAGSLNSMIFTTLACLCVLSFLVGVLTDPGRVPSSYIPDVEDTSFASDQEPKKNYYEGIRAAWLAKKSGLSYRHPFDISVYKNITLVLGPNTLRWFCPTSTSHLKDGVSFPTLRDSS